MRCYGSAPSSILVPDSCTATAALCYINCNSTVTGFGDLTSYSLMVSIGKILALPNVLLDSVASKWWRCESWVTVLHFHPNTTMPETASKCCFLAIGRAAWESGYLTAALFDCAEECTGGTTQRGPCQEVWRTVQKGSAGALGSEERVMGDVVGASWDLR